MYEYICEHIYICVCVYIYIHICIRIYLSCLLPPGQKRMGKRAGYSLGIARSIYSDLDVDCLAKQAIASEAEQRQNRGRTEAEQWQNRGRTEAELPAIGVPCNPSERACTRQAATQTSLKRSHLPSTAFRHRPAETGPCRKRAGGT